MPGNFPHPVVATRSSPAAVVAVVLTVFATILLAGAKPASAGAATCAHSDDTRATASLAQLEKSVLCLVNQKRSSLDRHRLDRNGDLNQAAQRHTHTMLKKDCFKHQCPGEPGLGKRVHKSGYLDGANRWRYAENTGCALRPRDMLHAWLQTRFTRKNLLNGDFRDVGIGAGKGAPSRCSHDPAMTTYTAVFAWREP
jgi:uncharacterized protein YkwD